MNTKTSDFRQKMPEKTVVKDAYSAQKIKKAVIWAKSQTFLDQVKIFKPTYLSFLLSKMENLSAHQIENFLNFFKLPILLIMVPFWRELWPIKLWNHERPVLLWKIVFLWGALHLEWLPGQTCLPLVVPRILQLHREHSLCWVLYVIRWCFRRFYYEDED